MSLLVVKASFGRGDPLVKRLTFRGDPSDLTFAVFKRKLDESFAHYASESNSIRCVYVDNDGEETVIACDNDLSEAIEYLTDDESQSSASGARSSKCTYAVQCIWVALY